ncbi:hypothetical protein [Pantoea eucrina]|uniref:hypothetical protein n=1 Tax=Pantoea eucrina TaxID=472693 RepID=UPI00301BC716
MITEQQIDGLIKRINGILQEDRAKMKFSFHFAQDRLNDPRNNPDITIDELEYIFTTFINRHLQQMLKMDEGCSFTIKCSKSHIAIPCAIQHELEYGATWVVQQVVTVMRKQDFKTHPKDQVFTL